MEKKAYTCIVCPRSCRGVLILDKGEMKCSGYKCKRGEKYAKNEFTAPKRMLTTTVNVKNANIKRLPVVSNKEIYKNKLFGCLEYLYSLTFQAPVKAGDVLVQNILDTQADIIAAIDLVAKQ